MLYFDQILLTYNIAWPLVCKTGQGFAEHLSGGQLVQMLIILESRYILIKFCLLIHVNICWPLVCKSGTKLCRASVQQWSVIENSHYS